jgi:hypothetical protein
MSRATNALTAKFHAPYAASPTLYFHYYLGRYFIAPLFQRFDYCRLLRHYFAFDYCQPCTAPDLITAYRLTPACSAHCRRLLISSRHIDAAAIASFIATAGRPIFI